MRKYTFRTLCLLLMSCGIARAQTELFVAPGGRDSDPGTRAEPLASLAGARDAIRSLKAAAGLPDGGVTVWIAEGSYTLREPLLLTEEDSGAERSPIRYRAVKGASVRVRGGSAVAGFARVEDPEILSRLDPVARAAVLQVHLPSRGFQDLGQAAARGDRLELFFRDQPMPLARWPNEGFARVGKLLGGEPFEVHGRRGDRVGKFGYEGDRPERWKREGEIWLHGYWFWDWSDGYERVAEIDCEQRWISTRAPHHGYGFREGQRYYALNLLSELDSPGEWYLDRSSGILYFWPPAPAANPSVVLSRLPGLFTLRGCSWIGLQGLILEATRGTAIEIAGGEHDRVSGCVVRNTGAWGVRISGGREHSVLGCDLYRCGEGGVSLQGGDRRKLEASRHAVVNCHIHHFGRLLRTYRPAVAVSGVGQRVAHNHIHDGPHNAIQLSGNDHVIEFNEIDHVCHETGDVGAFYMGRDWTERGTAIRHNYFHHIEGPGLHGAMAVYLDDSASGQEISGNLFYRASRAVFIGGGRDNRVENNIFVECKAAVHVDARGVGWMKYHVEEGGTLPRRLQAVPYSEAPWSERYPALVGILADEPGLPKGNLVRRNISCESRWLDVEKKALPLVAFEDNLVDRDPMFADRAKLDFRLRPTSPALAMGFQPLPLERMGLVPGEHRELLPRDGARRPHILFILADDLGWGDIGYHGSRIETPNIDGLAQEGVRLEQFYVQPVCSPTRGALLTGRYPMRLGLQCGVVRPWARHGLPLEERTLPQALREVGYTTAICGKWHLGHSAPVMLPTRRGFDLQYGHYNGALDYFTHQRDGGHDWHRQDRANHDEGYTTHLIAEEACRIIADHDKSTPLFLYVPFNAPHTPLQVPQRYLARYAHIENERRRTYAAMVSCLDEAIGRILHALREHGFPEEQTLICFCSDNGGVPSLGSNGPLRAGKGRLYEGGIRVPAIWTWPGELEKGAVVDEPLHIVDVYPTLLGLAGVSREQPLALDGCDAWEAISAGGRTPHEFILHNATPFHGAIRVGDWKLVHNGHVGALAGKAAPREKWELFHIAEDLSEEHELGERHPEILERLKKKLGALSAEAVPAVIVPGRRPEGFRVPEVWGQGE